MTRSVTALLAAAAGLTLALTAPAGVVQLQTIVRDDSGQTIEEDTRSVTVPDFNGDALTLSTPSILCAHNPSELKALRQAIGEGMKFVTPGVRPVGSDKGDQARVATPADAIANGADYIVVGRPIIAATDPLEAAESIAAEIRRV